MYTLDFLNANIINFSNNFSVVWLSTIYFYKKLTLP